MADYEALVGDLRQIGWCPEGFALPSSPPENWLVWLSQGWQRLAEQPSDQQPSDQQPSDRSDEVSRSLTNGAILELTGEGPWSGSLLGTRWLWRQRAMNGPKVAFVSSRLGSDVTQYRWWLRAIRELVGRLPASAIVITSLSMSSGGWSELAGRLAHRRVLVVDKPAATPFVWRQQMVSHRRPVGRIRRSLTTRLALSPLTAAGKFRRSQRYELLSTSRIPHADRSVVGLADYLVVGPCRKGGATERLTGYWSMKGRPFCRVSPVEDASAEWTVEPSEQSMVRWFQGAASDPPIPEFRPSGFHGEYLSHWTRADWPTYDEGVTKSLRLNERFTNLILNVADADGSATGVLRKILLEQRLAASSKNLRGGQKAVCFTGVPLEEWRSRRVFRSHLRRWDFEWFGLGIRREWLESRGVKPVIYGGDLDYLHLEPSQRPFFQKAHSGTATRVDWTSEREWRILGDLDLTELSSRDAFVFVPSAEQGVQLAPFSRWPIYRVPGLMKPA